MCKKILFPSLPGFPAGSSGGQGGVPPACDGGKGRRRGDAGRPGRDAYHAVCLTVMPRCRENGLRAVAVPQPAFGRPCVPPAGRRAAGRVCGRRWCPGRKTRK